MKVLLLLLLLSSCSINKEVITEEKALDYILTLQDNVWESISLKCGDDATYTEMWNEYLTHKDKYNSLPYDIVDPTF